MLAYFWEGSGKAARLTFLVTRNRSFSMHYVRSLVVYWICCPALLITGRLVFYGLPLPWFWSSAIISLSRFWLETFMSSFCLVILTEPPLEVLAFIFAAMASCRCFLCKNWRSSTKCYSVRLSLCSFRCGRLSLVGRGISSTLSAWCFSRFELLLTLPLPLMNPLWIDLAFPLATDMVIDFFERTDLPSSESLTDSPST